MPKENFKRYQMHEGTPEKAKEAIDALFAYGCTEHQHYKSYNDGQILDISEEVVNERPLQVLLEKYNYVQEVSRARESEVSVKVKMREIAPKALQYLEFAFDTIDPKYVQRDSTVGLYIVYSKEGTESLEQNASTYTEKPFKFADYPGGEYGGYSWSLQGDGKLYVKVLPSKVDLHLGGTQSLPKSALE